MLLNSGKPTIKKSIPHIRISYVKAIGTKLVAKLDLSEDIKKYFFGEEFIVQYHENIENVDESILTIAPLFVIAPVAWASGADIYVEKLDRYASDSLHRVRQVLQEWYPWFSPSGRLYANNLIDNNFGNKQTALLFSGGLDSMVSYIVHKDERPILITFLRGESPTYEAEHYEQVKDAFQDFARDEGVEIQFIKSDIWDRYSSILNNRLLAQDFHVTDWWSKVSHGLIFLGLSAPITVKKIRTLYIASTFEHDYKPPTGNGSHFLAFTDVSWSDIKVIYDGQATTRMKKIKDVLSNNRDYCRKLRICSPHYNPGYHKNSHSQTDFKNCGSCEKCVETITELIVADIDPAECNFDLNHKFLDYVRLLFATSAISFASERPKFWRDIQAHIPHAIDSNKVYKRYHADNFFKWFREFDISGYRWHTHETLRRLCLVYCLFKYRGVNDTIKLLIGNL